METDTLPIYEFFIIKKKKKSHPHYRRICVTCKLEKQLFRVAPCIENYSPKLLQNFKKLSITESHNSNVAGATLPKSLSVADILLPMLQEFRNIFLKNTSEMLLRQLVPFSM